MKITDYSSIVDEIENIGWEKLLSVNHNFTEIKFKMYDALNRQHVLNVTIMNSIPEFSAEYPRNINYKWQEVTTVLYTLNKLQEMKYHYYDYVFFCRVAH